MEITAIESTGLEEKTKKVRCPFCGHFLFVALRASGESVVEVKCRRCGRKIAVTLKG